MFTLEILDLNGVPDSNRLGPFDMIQSTTAPDQIDTLTTNSSATHGRYRMFHWQVPRDNGRPILSYTLRKMTPTGTVLWALRPPQQSLPERAHTAE